MAKTLDEFLDEQITEKLENAALSGCRVKDRPGKIRIRPVRIRNGLWFQYSWTEGSQAFQKNCTREETIAFLKEALIKEYRQLQTRTEGWEGTVLSGKKGNQTIRLRLRETDGGEEKKPLIQAHNRVRSYLLPEGTPVPFLVDLDVMTPEGKVHAARYDKFRQVNRFLEFVEDILPALPGGREITILDFGCGKSYLTFAMYYYLHEIRGLDIRIIGLDLKEDVIYRCNEHAKAYGYEKLEFFKGDVAEYHGVSSIDMMVTLHACDTATDYALARAVQWGARVILSVPCCQHELNRQISGGDIAPVLKYGILKERMSALLTDGIRAEILQCAGYRTQILEFIDMEHTPKNLLIRGVFTGNRKSPAEVEKMMQTLHLDPALYRLLYGEGVQ